MQSAGRRIHSAMSRAYALYCSTTPGMWGYRTSPAHLQTGPVPSGDVFRPQRPLGLNRVRHRDIRSLHRYAFNWRVSGQNDFSFVGLLPRTSIPFASSPLEDMKLAVVTRNGPTTRRPFECRYRLQATVAFHKRSRKIVSGGRRDDRVASLDRGHQEHLQSLWASDLLNIYRFDSHPISGLRFRHSRNERRTFSEVERTVHRSRDFTRSFALCIRCLLPVARRETRATSQSPLTPEHKR